MEAEKLAFSSDFNYQKIAIDSSGTTSVTNTNAFNVTLNHNLGYKPSVRVWFDPAQSRRYMASQQDYLDIVTFQSVTAFCWCSYYVTNSQLVITFRNQSGATRVFNYWYRIYYDA